MAYFRKRVSLTGDTLLYTNRKKENIMMTQANERGELQMKQYKIAICDDEVEYAFSLMNYINGEKEQPCLAMAFTSEENLQQYLKENTVELLLLGDHLTIELKEGTAVLWLTDGQEVVHENGVYKYQSAESLMQSIMEKVLENVETFSVVKKENFAIYGIYSPIGRCGKTNLAMGICRYHTGKCLYIGLEEYGSFLDEKGKNQEMLYYLKNREAGFSLRLNQFIVQQKGCYTIPSPCCYLDLKQITVEDMNWFIEQVLSEGTYQTMVFDIGTGSLSDFRLFELFHKIFVPILEEQTAQVKKEQFLKFIEKSQNIQWKEKLTFLNVPNVSYESLKMEQYIASCFQGVAYGE